MHSKKVVTRAAALGQIHFSDKFLKKNGQVFLWQKGLSPRKYISRPLLKIYQSTNKYFIPQGP